MPTITSKFNDSASDKSYGQTGNSAQQKAKWLYELERAQWQSRAHYQSAAPVRNTEKSNISGAVITETKKANIQIGDAPVLQVPKVQTPTLPTPVEHTQVAQALPSVFNEIVQNEILQLNTFQAQILPQSLTIGEQRALAAQDPISAEARETEQMQWGKQNIHLVENNGEISLWLRDARFTSSDGHGLYLSLQKRFADLGQKLAQLTINGRPVDPDQVVPSNHPTKQGD